MTTNSGVPTTDSSVVAFMARASAALGTALPAPKDVFGFGGSDPAATDRLLGKAVAGRKTGTTSWPVPEPLWWGVGDLSVILDGRGAPAALMRTLKFHRCRFKDVPREFGESEDEGSYEEYREGHVQFYRDGPNGHEFNDESMVLCETFQVIYALENESNPDL